MVRDTTSPEAFDAIVSGMNQPLDWAARVLGIDAARLRELARHDATPILTPSSGTMGRYHLRWVKLPFRAIDVEAFLFLFQPEVREQLEAALAREALLRSEFTVTPLRVASAWQPPMQNIPLPKVKP